MTLAENLIEAMPYALQYQLRDYETFLRNIAAEMALAAGQPQADDGLREKFVFAALLRRIFNMVDGQYYAIAQAVKIAKDNDFSGFSAGRHTFTSGSDEYGDVRRFLLSLTKFINDNEMGDVVSANSLPELMGVVARLPYDLD